MLGRGHSVLVYPGGDVDTHRPWTARHEIRFDGRKGFLRLAKEAGVPIVPVVSVGGQDTFLPLTDGRAAARFLRLDKLARLKVLPVSLALPWGLNVGDFLGHIPLPAKIRMELMEPIDVVERFGDDATSKIAYEYIAREDAGEAHGSGRRSSAPAVLMMIIRRSIAIDAPPSEVFELIDSPERYPEFFVGITTWESVSEQKSGIGARYRVLMKVGSIEAGGIVSVTEWADPEHIAWRWEQRHPSGRPLGAAARTTAVRR